MFGFGSRGQDLYRRNPDMMGDIMGDTRLPTPTSTSRQ